MIKQYLQKIFSHNHDLHTKKSLSLDFPILHNSFEVNHNSYLQNVIVFRCINLISQTASHVGWRLYKNHHTSKEYLTNHRILDLLQKPNSDKYGAEFLSDLISNKLLFGNSYILAQCHNNIPKELYLLPPQKMDLVIEKGILRGYKYKNSNKEFYFEINPISKMSKILHIKSYNPNNSFLGISPIYAAKNSIELHQMTALWNNNLLKNGARPSGALVMKDSNAFLTNDQFERLQEQLANKYSNTHNSGKPMILEGGLDWREMAINPKDMDFLEAKNSAAREIALSFGIPPQLLGIAGDNTYSNMQEARLALWEETLIPLLDKLSDALTNWFSHLFNEEIFLEFDKNSISALEAKKEKIWDKIINSNFMTINEKRNFVGLQSIPGGDIIKFEANQ
jgi:HK97 family phage portal protein